MLEGKAKADMEKAMEAYIEDEIERRMKNLSVHMVLDGEKIDAVVCDIDGGEIYVEIKTPIFFSETGKTGFVVTETHKRMAM